MVWRVITAAPYREGRASSRPSPRLLDDDDKTTLHDAASAVRRHRQRSNHIATRGNAKIRYSTNPTPPTGQPPNKPPSITICGEVADERRCGGLGDREAQSGCLDLVEADDMLVPDAGALVDFAPYAFAADICYQLFHVHFQHSFRSLPASCVCGRILPHTPSVASRASGGYRGGVPPSPRLPPSPSTVAKALADKWLWRSSRRINLSVAKYRAPCFRNAKIRYSTTPTPLMGSDPLPPRAPPDLPIPLNLEKSTDTPWSPSLRL